MAAAKHANICENERRIITLEQSVVYKDEKIEELIEDNKEIKKDINELTIAVTELASTLKIREEDSQKLENVENEIIQMKAGMQTLKYILPIIFTIVTIMISAISIVIQIVM